MYNVISLLNETHTHGQLYMGMGHDDGQLLTKREGEGFLGRVTESEVQLGSKDAL